jgi:tRNA A-37 threonylcarbamoyl transferase component Bud32/HEAT repeat protein
MQVCTSCKRLLKTDARQCPADGAAAEAVETLPKDTRLGAYKIDRMLGEGGMGFVYEATHEVLNRRSAIKMLRPELASHAQIVTRFLNEAKAVNLIDHQNIVNVYDYGDNQDGSVYFVMEFLEGETLDDLMRKRQPMQVPLLLHVFGQVGKALAAAHAKRIVHRDLKPANVFVVAREDNPYFIKLLDFGIAQLRGAGAVQGLTMAGSVMGTPQYMSPEQISGGTVDARSDVWALGVMLYRAATGQAPFKGEEFAELADKILHHVPPPAGELVAMPASLSTLIASCLERRVEDRCPSVAELLAGFERVKRECKLDDDAILATVMADAGAIGEAVPAALRDRTRGSLAGSVPRFQGAGVDPRGRRPGAGPATARSGVGRFVAIGAIVAGLGGAAYLVLGRGEGNVVATGTESNSSGPERLGSDDAKPPTIKDLVLAGDIAGARKLAEQHLHDAIASGTLQEKGFAVDALALVRVPAAAPLLYLALKEAPDVRVKAARALGELALPDSAPKVRAALAESGDKIKVELAAVLYRLGDKDARAILKRAIEDPGMRLTAALAMAESGDDAGRAALTDILDATPPGREPWRRAAGGLLKLGEANARKLLEGELAQPDAARSVGAAELLARAGDAKARELLARVAADHDFARPGEAAVALARLGDKRALGWVENGFKSADVDERTLALAISGLLAADAAMHIRTIATLATEDPELRVRMTAEAVFLGLEGVR